MNATSTIAASVDPGDNALARVSRSSSTSVLILALAMPPACRYTSSARTTGTPTR
ncbi:hypothetical protein [Ornithinimicrobium kibberense]|uniref:hypothetical protein n=1 Tax=Ornithinimicrobium kibberense TaxID=282060 RepID=UPI003617A4E4